jgi:hypothetical protein
LTRPSTPSPTKKGKEDVDARDKRGHDEGMMDRLVIACGKRNAFAQGSHVFVR